MNQDYSNAIAFILEGDTEKVFYLNMLKHFCGRHSNWEFNRNVDVGNGEINYVVQTPNSSVLIRMYVVGTITNMTKAHSWFSNRCKAVYRGLKWTVFLCYDTDNYMGEITKFYEGDWYELRKQLKKGQHTNIIDLASSADIEDTMLLDSEGVFRFLGIEPIPIPGGSKGKIKMKKIFRTKGPGYAYHEGERAKPLIEALDLNKIISLSPIPFLEIEQAIADE